MHHSSSPRAMRAVALLEAAKGAFACSALRLVEAYGLWRARRWGVWLGAAGGSVYFPVELYELWHKPGPLKVVTLAVNVAIVVYLVWNLYRQRAPVASASVS